MRLEEWLQRRSRNTDTGTRGKVIKLNLGVPLTMAMN